MVTYSTQHSRTQWYCRMCSSNFAECSAKSINFIQSPQMAMGIYDEVYSLYMEQDAKESHWNGYTLQEMVWTQTRHQ